MKRTPYELSELVLDTPGSLREIGEKLSVSKGYVSMLKKVRANCAAQAIDFWKAGEIPFPLMRSLSYLARKDQLLIIRDFVRGSRDKDPSTRRAAVAAAMRATKSIRGVGLSAEHWQILLDAAREQFQDDDCQIDPGEVTRVEGGFWVPAHVWISDDVLKTK